MSAPTKLFDSFQLGALTLPNLIIMAPLTRNRAVPPGMVPSPLCGEILRPASFRRPRHYRSRCLLSAPRQRFLSMARLRRPPNPARSNFRKFTRSSKTFGAARRTFGTPQLARFGPMTYSEMLSRHLTADERLPDLKVELRDVWFGTPTIRGRLGLNSTNYTEAKDEDGTLKGTDALNLAN
jgi:hypothetical protein